MTKISSRYARALRSVIGTNASQLSETAASLNTAVKILSHETAQQFFGNPIVSNTDKERLIENIFEKELDGRLVSLLKLIIRNKKFSAISAIAENFQMLADSAGGVVTAQVMTASKLNEDSAKSLETALGKMSGRDVRVVTVENPDLIAGIKIAIDGDMIDLSLAGKLKKLAGSLK